VSWEVEYTDQFEAWWNDLADDQQEAIAARVQLLEEHGPNLGRPTVEFLQDTRVHNLKELRCSKDGSLRVIFVFDPRRAAILLLGGDKSEWGWTDWYRRRGIPEAEALYEEHLQELRDEEDR
jgi:hypothetical protein